jgi:nucleotide-binding universal stress UspA family protein
MEERILVPLDGTAVGEAVLPKLEDLVLKTTPRLDAEVTILKVISKMNFNMLHEEEAAQLPRDEQELKQLTDESQTYLDSIAAGLTTKGFRVKTMIRHGNAAQEIVKAAHDIKAHIIAMSTHGRSGMVRWAIGSVTDTVMRLEGSIPVLAVKASGDKTSSPVMPIESLQSLMKHN